MERTTSRPENSSWRYSLRRLATALVRLPKKRAWLNPYVCFRRTVVVTRECLDSRPTFSVSLGGAQKTAPPSPGEWNEYGCGRPMRLPPDLSSEYGPESPGGPPGTRFCAGFPPAWVSGSRRWSTRYSIQLSSREEDCGSPWRRGSGSEHPTPRSAPRRPPVPCARRPPQASASRPESRTARRVRRQASPLPP